MAIFLSAGHHLKDSGAVSPYGQENLKTIEFRDLVHGYLKCNHPKHKVIMDYDHETLGQYLARIKTGNGSVVFEPHFDAFNGFANGSTALIPRDYDVNDQLMGQEMVDAVARILGVKNRGVKTELESARKSLALMRKEGTVVLLELVFIDNEEDMLKYEANKCLLAEEIARILVKFDDLIE